MTTNEPSTQNTAGLRKGPRPKKSASNEIVVIDYDGVVGRATADKDALTDQQPVRHTMSPRIFFWPVNGTPDLNLQPGINLVPADLWKKYTESDCDGEKGLPQLMALIDSEQIINLEGKPPSRAKELIDLIDRSMSPDGIQWIIDQERADKNRAEIVTRCEARLAKVRPVRLKPMTFQGRVPNVKAGAEAPSLAM